MNPHRWIFSGGCPHSAQSSLSWAEDLEWQKEALNASSQGERLGEKTKSSSPGEERSKHNTRTL